MAVVIRWTTPAKKTLDIVQNTYYTNSFHLRVAHPPRRRSFCHGRMLYKKTSRPVYQKRDLSPRFTRNNQNTSRVFRGFFKTWRFFTRDIPNWYVYRNNTQNWHVHQKINLAFSKISNTLFVILCTSRPLFPISCCITKRRAKTAGKTRNTTDFLTNSNPLEVISNTKTRTRSPKTTAKLI